MSDDLILNRQLNDNRLSLDLFHRHAINPAYYPHTANGHGGNTVKLDFSLSLATYSTIMARPSVLYIISAI